MEKDELEDCAKRRSRRERLLDVAREHLIRYGARKITVGEIANAAGIGVGTLYLEFPNKDALVYALAEEQYAKVLTDIDTILRGTNPPREQLRRALTARVDRLKGLAAQGPHAADLLFCTHSDAVKRAHHAFCTAEHKLFLAYFEIVNSHEKLEVQPKALARTLGLACCALNPPKLFGYELRELERNLKALSEVMAQALPCRTAE